MAEVESFQLDHTKVLAPYVRLIGAETGPDAAADGSALATGDVAEATALAATAGAMVIGRLGGSFARTTATLPASSAPWGITAKLRNAENCW